MIFKALCALVLFFFLSGSATGSDMKVELPVPRPGNELSRLLEKRHSCRLFQSKPLKLSDLAEIIWATCGKKFDAESSATRTIPSAGGTYPLELYLVVGDGSVDGLKSGVYNYSIDKHLLMLVHEGDKRKDLASACLGQGYIAQAPASLVITGIFDRTTGRYSDRGNRYVYMEAGHACQNTYLAATSLGLGTVEVGAFSDNAVTAALGIDARNTPLSIMPIGYEK